MICENCGERHNRKLLVLCFNCYPPNEFGAEADQIATENELD